MAWRAVAALALWISAWGCLARVNTRPAQTFDEFLLKAVRGEEILDSDKWMEEVSGNFTKLLAAALPEVKSSHKAATVNARQRNDVTEVTVAQQESTKTGQLRNNADDSDENRPASGRRGRHRVSTVPMVAQRSVGKSFIRTNPPYAGQPQDPRSVHNVSAQRSSHHGTRQEEEMSGSGVDPDAELDDGPSDPASRLNSAPNNQVLQEPRRRHSRRHLDLDQIESQFRGIPRDQWNCCDLGALAGDKGFSCETRFYRPSILDRNANRVHNRRLTGRYFEDGVATPPAVALMQSFETCIVRQSDEFYRCCTQTLHEYNNRRRRWHAFNESLVRVQDQ